MLKRNSQNHLQSRFSRLKTEVNQVIGLPSKAIGGRNVESDSTLNDFYPFHLLLRDLR